MYHVFEKKAEEMFKQNQDEISTVSYFFVNQKTNNPPLPNCVSKRGERRKNAKWHKDSDTEIQSKYRSSKVIEKHSFGKFYIKATNVASRKTVKGPVNGYRYTREINEQI